MLEVVRMAKMPELSACHCVQKLALRLVVVECYKCSGIDFCFMNSIIHHKYIFADKTIILSILYFTMLLNFSIQL